MANVNRIPSSTATHPKHPALTPAELRQGLASVSESGFEDAHPIKGHLPPGVKAAFAKLPPGQEHYQVTVKGHAVYVAVNWTDPPQHRPGLRPGGQGAHRGHLQGGRG